MTIVGNWVRLFDRVKNLLFRRAIDMKIKDKDGRTALHTAVIMEDSEMIKLILAHGAVVDVKDEWGETPAFLTSDPKTRMILHNHENAHSKGSLLSGPSTATASPPEYQA